MSVGATTSRRPRGVSGTGVQGSNPLGVEGLEGQAVSHLRLRLTLAAFGEPGPV